MTKHSLPDELISGYLDNQISPEERRQVELMLAAEPRWEQLLSELRDQRRQLQNLPRFELSPDWGQRFCQRKEIAQTLADFRARTPSPTQGPKPNHRGIRYRLIAMISSLAALVLIVAFLYRPASQDVPLATREGDGSGQLELASDQSNDDDISSPATESPMAKVFESRLLERFPSGALPREESPAAMPHLIDSNSVINPPMSARELAADRASPMAAQELEPNSSGRSLQLRHNDSNPPPPLVSVENLAQQDPLREGLAAGDSISVTPTTPLGPVVEVVYQTAADYDQHFRQTLSQHDFRFDDSDHTDFRESQERDESRMPNAGTEQPHQPKPPESKDPVEPQVFVIHARPDQMNNLMTHLSSQAKISPFPLPADWFELDSFNTGRDRDDINSHESGELARADGRDVAEANHQPQTSLSMTAGTANVRQLALDAKLKEQLQVFDMQSSTKPFSREGQAVDTWDYQLDLRIDRKNESDPSRMPGAGIEYEQRLQSKMQQQSNNYQYLVIVKTMPDPGNTELRDENQSAASAIVEPTTTPDGQDIK